MAMRCGLSSKIRRRSSCARSHHASDFLTGISAARVDPARPSGSWRAASSRCSPLVTYRSLLVTPRSTQTASPAGPAAPEPSTTSSREAGGSGMPATVSSRSMLHLPLLPPTNATCNGGTRQPYSHRSVGSGLRTDARGQAERLDGPERTQRPHGCLRAPCSVSTTSTRKTAHAPSDEYGQFCRSGWRWISRWRVVATVTKGHDLDYFWKQVDRGPAKDAPATTFKPAKRGASRLL